MGCAALLGRSLTLEADPAAPHWAVQVAAPIAATLVATSALFLGTGEQALRAGFVAGTILTAHALGSWLIGLARRPLVATRRWLRRELDVTGTRLVDVEGGPGARELAIEFQPTIRIFAVRLILAFGDNGRSYPQVFHQIRETFLIKMGIFSFSKMISFL